MCNRLGLRKQPCLDAKLQVGKKIMCQLFYQFTGSVTQPCAIKVGQASAQKIKREQLLLLKD